MRKLLLIFIFTTGLVFGQTEPDLSVKVQVTKEVHLTTAERDLYVVPANQTWNIYNTTTGQKEINVGGAGWVASGSGSGSDADWYQTGTTAPPTNVLDDIFTNGKVGIGGETLNYALSIDGGALEAYEQFMNDATGRGVNDGFFFGVDSNGAPLIYNGENNDMTFYNNSVSRMVIKAGGDVEYSSDVFVNGGLFRVNALSGNPELQIVRNGSSQGAKFYMNSSNQFIFQNTANNAANAIRILENTEIDGELNMSTNKIIDVVDPTSPQDAATKAYVDANSGGNFLPLIGGTLTGAVNGTQLGSNGSSFAAAFIDRYAHESADGEFWVWDSSVGNNYNLGKIVDPFGGFVPLYGFNPTGTPAQIYDVATKAYVDANSGGGTIADESVTVPKLDRSGNPLPIGGEIYSNGFGAPQWIDNSAANTSYDNTTSGAAATTVKGMLDELAASGGGTTSTNISYLTVNSDIELNNNHVKGANQQSVETLIQGNRTLTLGDLITENKKAIIRAPNSATDSVKIKPKSGFDFIGKDSNGNLLTGSEDGIYAKKFEPIVFSRYDADTFIVDGDFLPYTDVPPLVNILPEFAGVLGFENSSIAPLNPQNISATLSVSTTLSRSGSTSYRFDDTTANTGNFAYSKPSISVNVGDTVTFSGWSNVESGTLLRVGIRDASTTLTLHTLSNTAGWNYFSFTHTFTNVSDIRLYTYGDGAFNLSDMIWSVN